MLDKRIFRIYYHQYPYVPAMSYKHIIANDEDDAKNIINKAVENNKEFFDSIGFILGIVSEEKFHSFFDHFGLFENE